MPAKQLSTLSWKKVPSWRKSNGLAINPGRQTKLVIFSKGIYDSEPCRTADISRGKSFRSHNGPAT